MPDLADGASAEVQGSSGSRYVLKNVAGVYSCSCPAWRNQSLSIDRRTCKHLRAFRGEVAEQARIGTDLPAKDKEAVPAVQAPPLLLAETWDGHSDLSGWWMSEKLDGVRAYWNGTVFLSRQGNRYFAPDWFTAGLPAHPLDGELWLGRKLFQRAVCIVRRQDGGDLWKEIRFRIFDAPQVGGTFEDRLAFVRECLAERQPAFAQVHEHVLCLGASHLHDELARVESLGGEGLMLRQPGSHYEAGRSATLVKVKSFHDAEARVIEHQPGSGRHRGRLGALLVELTDGTRFAVGTGLSDAERENPPPVGSIITFRYQELTDAGVPRFPVYVGVRQDILIPQKKGAESMASNTSSKPRRFEFVGGSSCKFWEVQVNGKEVVVCFGRIGTGGQTQTKSFADETAATQHADKMVKEKLGKGYRENGSSRVA